MSCPSPSVAPDSSWFNICHLSLVQQTLPFLRSKGFKTCFLELPFLKLGGTYHGEGGVEAAASAPQLPALGGPVLGLILLPVPSTSTAFLGTVGTSPPMGQEEPAWGLMGQMLLNP